MEKMNSEEEKAKLDLERVDQDQSDDSADVPASPRSVHGFAVRRFISLKAFPFANKSAVGPDCLLHIDFHVYLLPRQHHCC